MEQNKLMTKLETKLMADGIYKSTSHDFMQLTTNEDRVICLLKLMSKYDIYPSNLSKKKNPFDAKQYREEGNKIYIDGTLTSWKCVQALMSYNKSIAFSPCKSQELAFTYANRSAILFRMQKYAECVQDIDRALALDYPEYLRVKLYLRKTECLMKLNNPSVQDSLEELQQLTEKISLNEANKEKLKKKLQALRTVQKCKTVKVPHKQEPVFEVSLETVNHEAPCASAALAIKYTEPLGRHIVATRQILPGEILVIEKPYSIVLKIPAIYSHCANCMNVCWSSIPCDHCVYALYCSEECKTAHWDLYHDVECPIFGHLIEQNCVMLDLFTVRLTVQAVREASSIEELRQMTRLIDECSDPRMAGFSSDGKLHSDSYQGIYSLETNVEKRSFDSLFRRALDACCILYYIVTQTNFFGRKLNPDTAEWVLDRDITFFASLLLRHQMTIPTNMHDFAEAKCLDYKSYAVGALSFCSLCNHSCCANMSRFVTPDNKLVMYATSVINEGEQLFDNYGQHYALKGKVQRQRLLSEQYFFDCECTACTEDWPLYFDQVSYQYLVSPFKRWCMDKFAEKLRPYMELMTFDDVQNDPGMEQDLVKIVMAFCSYCPPPYREMSYVVELLTQVMSLKYGRKFEMPKIL